MSLVMEIGGRGVRTALAITWAGDYAPGHMVSVRDPHDHMVLGLDAGTRVLSDRGLVPARALTAGDRVADGRGGWSRIATTLIASTEIGRDRIAISPGALGPGVPASDLVVGRRHRLCLRADLAEHLTGKSAGLVPADALLDFPGVSLTPGIMHEVVHIVLEHHGFVVAEDVVLESFAPTPALLESLPVALVDILFEALPRLRYHGGLAAYVPQLPELDAREVARLMGNDSTFSADPGNVVSVGQEKDPQAVWSAPGTPALSEPSQRSGDLPLLQTICS